MKVCVSLVKVELGRRECGNPDLLPVTCGPCRILSFDISAPYSAGAVTLGSTLTVPTVEHMCSFT